MNNDMFDRYVIVSIDVHARCVHFVQSESLYIRISGMTVPRIQLYKVTEVEVEYDSGRKELCCLRGKGLRLLLEEYLYPAGSANGNITEARSFLIMCATRKRKEHYVTTFKSD